MKHKIFYIALSTLSLFALAGCSNHSNSKPTAEKADTSKVTKIKKTKVPAENAKPDKNAKNRTWTYKNNVYDAGIETYTFTKSEVRDSAEPGKKILVLYCNVRNNYTKEEDPSNVYMVVHANQKTSTSNVQLAPAASTKLDDNGNDPLQKYIDNMQNKLLPGKTVKAVMMWTLKNDNPVKITFQDPNFNEIGSKTYIVK